MFLCSVFALRFTKTKTDIHYKLKILWRAVVETLPLMLVVLQIISDTTRSKQSGGTGSVRNGPGVSNSPQNSGRGGYSGVPNTDKSDEERVCVGGRTPDQIQQAHQYAVDVVEAFVLEGNVAIGMDAVLLNELFKRVKLPRKLDKIKEQVKDIVIGIYASAGAYTLGQVANLTKSRLRGELRQALRTCR